MKRHVHVFAFVSALLFSSSIFAQNEAYPGTGSFALGGITGGHPYIGGTVKYWLSDKLALDGSMGFAANLDIQANLTFNKKYGFSVRFLFRDSGCRRRGMVHTLGALGDFRGIPSCF